MKRIPIAFLALMLVAGVASAHNGGAADHGPGGPGDGGLDGGRAIVGSDGTIYVMKAATDAAGAKVAQIVAIRSTGTTAWTVTLATERFDAELSGSNLIVETESTTNSVTTTTLTAYSTASGTAVWTKALDGRASRIEPFSGGTYVIVVKAATTTGGTATRTLVSLGNDGSTLWSVAL